MDIINYLRETSISIVGSDVSLGRLIVVIISLILLLYAYRAFIRYIFKRYAEIRKISPESKRRIRTILRFVFITFSGLFLVWGLDWNVDFFPTRQYKFSLLNIFQVLFIIEIAWFTDWIASRVILPKYFKAIVADKNLNEQTKQKITNHRIRRSIQYTIACLAILFITNKTQFDFTLFSFPIGKDNSYVPLRLSNIVFGVLIVLLARIISWAITQFSLRSYYTSKKIAKGSQIAISQLINYVIFVIAIFSALQVMGFQITILIGGLAALLVGVGLGLQQTFNDLMSGIIILFERSVEVGDVIEINEMVGTVQHIGLRSSIVEGRDNISIIVPNSKLVVENVINWSHTDDKIRFSITVGVDYKSDPEEVRNILLEIGEQNPYILNFPKPIVRLTNFGDFALNFEFLFWSRNYLIIEDVKSDLRFEISAAFKKSNITIPFPQQDVWLRNVQ